MIFIDLQKAFDKMNHEVFLQKLKAIKFSDQSIQWFKFHFFGWIILVETKNKILDFEKISGGLRQGSILGPLLFLIYVDDIYASSSKIKFTFVCWWFTSCVPT